MIAINHTLISEDVFDKKFVCDLNACKGQCCISGDSGAPLNKKEIAILDKVYPMVKPYMNEKGIAAVENQGVSPQQPLTLVHQDKAFDYSNYSKY